MKATVDVIPSAGSAGIAHLNPSSKHDERVVTAKKRWHASVYTSISGGTAPVRKTHIGSCPNEVLRTKNARTVGNTSMTNHSLAIGGCIQRKAKVGVQNEFGMSKTGWASCVWQETEGSSLWVVRTREGNGYTCACETQVSLKYLCTSRCL